MRRLDHCRFCLQPFGPYVVRSDSPNICVGCRLERGRATARARYEAIKAQTAARRGPTYQGNGLTAHSPGVEAWPEPQNHADAERKARGIRYHADLLAGRPIRWIPQDVQLVKQGNGACTGESDMQHEEPKEQCQYCEGWEQDTCVHTDSDWWNMRRGAACTCTEFHRREVRKRKRATISS
jgi:hypothetical protein